jgi:hypothetical protein
MGNPNTSIWNKHFVLFYFSSYSQSSTSRQSYSGSTITRLIQSSGQSSVVDEYGDQQQVLYERSPNNSGSFVYETRDGISSNAPVLTEEVLLRSHANNGGKFPTHLLTQLGSQIYDIPSDQADATNNGRRVTTTTTTRYYTTNPGEIGYESAIDETSPQYGEEKYIQMRASDLNALTNYDAYSNTGEKLEGEQSNY